MKTAFFGIAWLITLPLSAQYLKIDNGVVVSSFSNDRDMQILNSRVVNYTGLVGLDYLESNWFSLSSQIGFLRIGGEQELASVTPEFGEITEEKSYVHINTTIRPRLDMGAISLFVGVGPTLDILISDAAAENVLFTGYTYNGVRLGGKAEIGLLHTQNKVRVGFIGGYLRNFSSTTETDFISLTNHAFTAVITAGYRLQ